MLSGVIQPGQYFLVQEAQGNAGSASLPTPDVAGQINLSASDGKVALVNNSTVLSGSAPTGPAVVDFVGYGSANAFEGSAAPALSNTTAAVRQSGALTPITTELTSALALPILETVALKQTLAPQLLRRQSRTLWCLQ
jgi:hypothetical protein